MMILQAPGVGTDRYLTDRRISRLPGLISLFFSAALPCPALWFAARDDSGDYVSAMGPLMRSSALPRLA